MEILPTRKDYVLVEMPIPTLQSKNLGGSEIRCIQRPHGNTKHSDSHHKARLEDEVRRAGRCLGLRSVASEEQIRSRE